MALPRKDQRGVRFVPPGNWHVTLRFLGEADPADVCAALEHVALPRATVRIGPGVDVMPTVPSWCPSQRSRRDRPARERTHGRDRRAAEEALRRTPHGRPREAARRDATSRGHGGVGHVRSPTRSRSCGAASIPTGRATTRSSPGRSADHETHTSNGGNPVVLGVVQHARMKLGPYSRTADHRRPAVRPRPRGRVRLCDPDRSGGHLGRQRRHRSQGVRRRRARGARTGGGAHRWRPRPQARRSRPHHTRAAAHRRLLLRRALPRSLLLLCGQASPVGGESFLVDGYAVLDALAADGQRDLVAWLSSTPIDQTGPDMQRIGRAPIVGNRTERSPDAAAVPVPAAVDR